MLRGLTGLFIAVISFVSLVVIGLGAIFLTLPDVRKLGHCMTTELYHVYLCENDPHFVPLKQISPYIIGAVIMSEDGSFYSHPGVDLYEMKESVKKDLGELRFARGASTITQQLAKNVFLSKKKNLIRKIEEIYLALQMEKYFNKGQILTYYLNVVEFGDNMYGVKQACRTYFDKAPDEVTPEEAAFLAFLLPNPKKYSQNIYRHKLTPYAAHTIKTILHRMNISHKLSDEEYATAMAHMPDFPWRGEPTSTAEAGETSVSEQPTPSETPDANNQDDDEFKFDFTPEEK